MTRPLLSTVEGTPAAGGRRGSLAVVLESTLREGVRRGGRAWDVRRAWPADLRDASKGLVFELIDRDGRIGAATLGAEAPAAGATGPELFLCEHDPALPALTDLRAEGWNVLAHRFGKRAVLRRDGPAVFRKLATPRATRRALARLDAVNRTLAVNASGGECGVPLPPRVLQADPRAGTLDLEPVPGVSLRALLTDPATDADRAWRVGRALGGVLTSLAHIERPSAAPDGPEPVELPTHSLAEEATVLERWVDAAVALAVTDSAEAERLAGEREAICAELRAMDVVEPVVLAHRDVHDGQVLVDSQDAVVLLDWDTACWADPCVDPANLLAHLDLLVHQVPQAGNTVASATSGLWAGLLVGDHPALTRPARLELLRRASALRIAAVHAFRVPGGIGPAFGRAS